METINFTTPKARKNHICDYCNDTIDKGEVYNSQTNRFEGDIYVWKAHINCSEIASLLNMHDECDDGVTADDFSEYINNEYSELCEFEPPSKTFSNRLDEVVKYYTKLKDTVSKISKTERVIILHTCGLDQSPNQYRNRYILDKSKDVPVNFVYLKGLGLMDWNGDNIAFLTTKGLKLAKLLNKK